MRQVHRGFYLLLYPLLRLQDVLLFLLGQLLQVLRVVQLFVWVIAQDGLLPRLLADDDVL